MIIIFHVVTSNRPQCPPNTRWLKDQIWNMITTCWSENREQRWNIRTVYNQFLVSSFQEIVALDKLGNQCHSQVASILKGLFPIHRCADNSTKFGCHGCSFCGFSSGPVNTGNFRRSKQPVHPRACKCRRQGRFFTRC